MWPSFFPPKRKVFVSYHSSDQAAVDAFVQRWVGAEDVFIPKSVGVADYGADPIASTDTDYIINKIREKYLGDSSVTLLLVGQCTHSRRYIDWELKASLRRWATCPPNGVLAIALPPYTILGGQPHVLPPRFEENWNNQKRPCYGRYYWPPQSAIELRGWIEEAFNARTTRDQCIQNSADRMIYNAVCQVHGITH